jgi:type IV pilus assembly protein PilA
MKLHEVIARLRAGKKNDEGFTLIELLVVVVIIGVLVAIAVPVYLNYRQGAADKAAQSDVRGAISAIEQFYTANSNTYPAAAESANANGGTIPLNLSGGGAAQAGSITVSDGTSLGYAPGAGGAYLICAWNEGGTDGKWFLYNSAEGGSVSEQADERPTLTTCS